jgi:hypothetical protein
LYKPTLRSAYGASAKPSLRAVSTIHAHHCMP